MTFYENYCELCDSRHISTSAAAKAAGLSKSIVTKWSKNPDAVPNGETLTKVATFFGISVAELLAPVNGCAAPSVGDTLGEAKRIAMSLNQDELFELQKAVMSRIMEITAQKK